MCSIMQRVCNNVLSLLNLGSHKIYFISLEFIGNLKLFQGIFSRLLEILVFILQLG